MTSEDLVYKWMSHIFLSWMVPIDFHCMKRAAWTCFETSPLVFHCRKKDDDEFICIFLWTIPEMSAFRTSKTHKNSRMQEKIKADWLERSIDWNKNTPSFKVLRQKTFTRNQHKETNIPMLTGRRPWQLRIAYFVMFQGLSPFCQGLVGCWAVEEASWQLEPKNGRRGCFAGSVIDTWKIPSGWVRSI